MWTIRLLISQRNLTNNLCNHAKYSYIDSKEDAEPTGAYRHTAVDTQRGDTGMETLHQHQVRTL